MTLTLSDAVLQRRQFSLAVNKNLRRTTILQTLPPYISKDKIAVDVGGATGHITCFLAEHAHSVVSYEAVEPVFFQLKKMMDRYDNVTAFNAAVSNFDGTSTFFVDDKRLSNSGFQDLVGGQEVRANVLKLDTAFKRRERPVGFIKIDVEGTEIDVLEGAKEIIATNRPNIMIEIYEPYTKKPLGGIFKLLMKDGYKCAYWDCKLMELVEVKSPVDGVDAVKYLHKRHDGDFLFYAT